MYQTLCVNDWEKLSLGQGMENTVEPSFASLCCHVCQLCFKSENASCVPQKVDSVSCKLCVNCKLCFRYRPKSDVFENRLKIIDRLVCRMALSVSANWKNYNKPSLGKNKAASWLRHKLQHHFLVCDVLQYRAGDTLPVLKDWIQTSISNRMSIRFWKKLLILKHREKRWKQGKWKMEFMTSEPSKVCDNSTGVLVWSEITEILLLEALTSLLPFPKFNSQILTLQQK